MADLVSELRRIGRLDNAVALNLGTLSTNRFQGHLLTFDAVRSFGEPYSKNNSLEPLYDSFSWRFPPSMNWLYAERGLFSLEQTFFGRHVRLSNREALSLVSGAIHQARAVLAEHAPDFVFDNSYLGLQRLALRAACAELDIPLLTLRHALLSGRYRVSDIDDRVLQSQYGSALESSLEDRKEQVNRLHDLRAELRRVGSVVPEIKQQTVRNGRGITRLPMLVTRVAPRRKNIDREDYLAYRASSGRKVANRVVASRRAQWNRRILLQASGPFGPGTKRLAFTWHYQPEQSTSQGSPYFVHQARFVENVSRAMPLDWELVVVPYWNRLTHMKVSDAKILRLLPNVTVSRPERRTGDVLAECDAVVALTGTSGFEGLVLGKPVFVFGHPDWRLCRSATPIAAFDELTVSLRNIEHYRPDVEDVAAFVEALRSVSFELDDGRALSRRPDEVGSTGTYKADVRRVAGLLATHLEVSE